MIFFFILSSSFFKLCSSHVFSVRRHTLHCGPLREKGTLFPQHHHQVNRPCFAFFFPLYGRLVLLLLLLLIIIMHQRRSHTVKKWIVITHLHHHKEGEHFSFPFIRLEIQFQFQHVESMASQWIRFGLKVSYTTITQCILKNFNRWVLFVVLPTDNNSITTDDDDNDGLEPWQQQQKQEWIITNKTIYCTVLESARALICIRR